MTVDNPKVSVLVPIYNVEKYLKQCLDSVVNQTLKDIEIICINDGSTVSIACIFFIDYFYTRVVSHVIFNNRLTGIS